MPVHRSGYAAIRMRLSLQRLRGYNSGLSGRQGTAEGGRLRCREPMRAFIIRMVLQQAALDVRAFEEQSATEQLPVAFFEACPAD